MRYRILVILVLLSCWFTVAQAATLQVGPSRTLKIPSAAAAVAKDGDIVELDAGVYTGDAALWKANNLTVRGVGGRAIIQSQDVNIQTWGAWVFAGNNATVEHVEISGPHTDGAGSAIRLQGKGLTLRDVFLHDADHGLLTGNDAGTPTSDVLIEASEFTHNGMGEGQTHNIYVGVSRSLTMRRSYSHDSYGGQLVKSRAAKTTLENNRLEDHPDGTSNYEVDFSNGGVVTMTGNTIRQASGTSNGTIITFMPEGPGSNTVHSFVATDNVVTSERDPGYFFAIRGTPSPLTLTNNTLAGNGPALTVNSVETPLPPGNTRIAFVPLPVPPPPPPVPIRIVSALPLPPQPGWYELANTKLSAVCYSKPPFAPEGCRNVIDAWNSGVMDTKRNRLVIWGGGHNDYSGNEMYAVNLETLAAERLTDPGSPMAPSSCVPGASQPDCINGCMESIANGTQPNSRHTYDSLVYMTNLDQMFVFGGVLACSSGDTGMSTWVYDFGTKQWQRKHPTGPIPKSYIVATAYDAANKRVLLHDRRCLYIYDPVADAYSFMPNGYNCKDGVDANGITDYHFAGALDPDRQLFFTLQSGQQNWMYDVNPASPSYGRTSAFVTTGWTMGYYPGLAYDPISKHIMGWNGGDTVYSLDIDTKTWTPLVSPGGPGAGNGNGTYKRWSYSPKLDAFVVVNTINRNAFALRVPRGVTPPPPPPPVPPPCDDTCPVCGVANACGRVCPACPSPPLPAPAACIVTMPESRTMVITCP